MESCIYCRIIAGELPSKKVYENDQVLAFRDIMPQAPTHVLVIPKAHVPNLLAAKDVSGLMGAMMDAVGEVVRLENLEENGFRLVTNTGEHAGQTVQHLHFHVLGGAKLGYFGVNKEE